MFFRLSQFSKDLLNERRLSDSFSKLIEFNMKGVVKVLNLIDELNPIRWGFLLYRISKAIKPSKDFSAPKLVSVSSFLMTKANTSESSATLNISKAMVGLRHLQKYHYPEFIRKGRRWQLASTASRIIKKEMPENIGSLPQRQN